jgi:hypothetical protein
MGPKGLWSGGLTRPNRARATFGEEREALLSALEARMLVAGSLRASAPVVAAIAPKKPPTIRYLGEPGSQEIPDLMRFPELAGVVGSPG